VTTPGKPRKKPARKTAKKKPERPPRSTNTGKVKGTTVSPTRASDVLADMRQAEAMRLRTQGHSFRVIAAKLEVDVATAHRYVKAGLVALADETMAQSRHLRAMELARLDELLVKVWPFATGDLTPLIHQLEERQAELAEANPRAAKKSVVAKLLETFVDGIPQDDFLKRALNIITLRSRLLGLEAPVKHAHTDPTGEEERAVPVAFPVPPNLDPAAWQKFAQQAMQAQK